MKHHCRRTIAITALVFSALSFPGTAPVLLASDQVSPIRVSLQPADPQAEDPRGDPPRVTLIRGAYDVEIYGATALVTLAQEFDRTGDEELIARYGWTAEGRHQPELLLAESAGAIRTLGFEKQAPPAAPARRNTVVRGRSQAKADPQPGNDRTPLRIIGEPFTVEAEQGLWIRTAFRDRLAVRPGTLRLTLPPLREEGTPGGEQRAEPLPVSVTVTIHAPQLRPASPSHEILVADEGDRTVVELVSRDGLEDRPFVLDLRVAADDEASFSSFVGAETEGRRRVAASFLPPTAPREGTVRAKQVLFILDTSGSMRGGKLEQAREALGSCLEKLVPEDRFNIVEFDAKYTALAAGPLEASERDRHRASEWLAAQVAGGGTMLLPALEATLAQPADPQRHRMIIVITDGRLADEAAVLQLLEEKLDEGRLFVVGIGPSPNREAILRLADYGRGAATFAGGETELQAAVVELFDAISQPLAWDLHFDWGAAEVEEISPSRLPDLYANRPVKVLAWIRGDLPSELRLRVTTTAGERDYFVQLPPRRATGAP